MTCHEQTPSPLIQVTLLHHCTAFISQSPHARRDTSRPFSLQQSPSELTQPPTKISLVVKESTRS